MPGQRSQQVVRCGWLGSSATLNGPLKQGWWVLTAADSLSCFVSDSSASNSLECRIHLSKVLAVSAAHSARGFQVKTPTTTYAFVAESEASAESWRGAIHEARKHTVSTEEPSVSTDVGVVVERIKAVLVELDLILQAMVGMICGDDMLLQSYGVQLSIDTQQRLELLQQLGLDATQASNILLMS